MIPNLLDLLDSNEKGGLITTVVKVGKYFQSETNTMSVSIKKRTTELLIIHVKSVVT